MNRSIFFALLSFSFISYTMDLSVYSKDGIKQIIIVCAHDLKTGSANIAKKHADHAPIIQKISNKLENLFAIAANPNQQFTHDDLKNSWYLNATNVITQGKHNSQERAYTLLSLAMEEDDNLQLNKIKMILEAEIDCKDNINNGLLIDIAIKRARTNDEDKKYHYLEIARLLFENEANPNYQGCMYDETEKRLYKSPTALMLATHYKDTEYMELLLFKNARYCYPDMAQEYKENKAYWNGSYDFKAKEIFDVKTGTPIGFFKQLLHDRNIT